MAKSESRKTKRNQAAKARAREAHFRLVTEREGDPSFVQQTRTPTGRTISFGPDVADELKLDVEAIRAEFVAKFGREPTDSDPLIFDPDKDEPTPLTEEGMEKVLDTIRANAADAGIDPAFIEAWKEVGYVVTEANAHLLTAHEVEAFEDAVERARNRADRAGEPPLA